MTQDEIIEMAREAGFHLGKLETPRGARPLVKHSGFDCLAEVTRFAALVAAKEREACAQVCESWADEHDYAGAIRARSTP